MNRNTRIQISTPVGVTEERDVGETLGQGTIEGAVASAVNLDNGVTDFFKYSEDEVSYLNVQLAPLLFQDDVARLSMSVQSAQSGNERMRGVAETKLLNFNLDKSGYLLFGSKKRRQEMLSQLAANPLTLCGRQMKHFDKVKYLGDYLCENGLTESVHQTVMKRKGLATRAIYDIKCILEDCRSCLTGGLMSGLDIWELAVIPMLLYNCETWVDLSKKTIEELEKIQLQFIRTALSVGSGCPLPFLYSETGLLSMEMRILEKKLNFLHHLNQLPSTSLAKEVLVTQISFGVPGIYNDCREFLAKFEIFDLSLYSKFQFKKMIKGKIHQLNKSKFVEQAKQKRYKKIDLETFGENDFHLKPYFKEFNVADARLKFKLVSYMTPSVKMNFQSDRKFASDYWACEGCSQPGKLGMRDTQHHIGICPGYETLREGRDLEKDSD